LAGQVPEVSFPDYVRDNIHVSLLAKVYARAAGNIDGRQQWNPSGYCESQGEFTKRFAREMEARLSIPCLFQLKEQTEFTEPKSRINTQTVDATTYKWDEGAAWDKLAHYYKTYYG
jgi:UDP-glucose 4-epimerase